MATTLYEGGCHCRRIAVTFETDIAPESLAFRKCGCDFCRRAGAVYVSDPKGRLTIAVESDDSLTRYRFGTEQAAFLSCANCGTYIGALEAEDEALAVLNARILSDDFKLPADEAAVPVMDYDGEAPDTRKGRWSERWTPARLKVVG